MTANRHWTDEELEHLRWNWGYRSIKMISKDLDRSAHAITKKARDLKLGPPSKRGMSLRAFERYSGFSYLKITQAAKKLGVALPTAYSGDAGRGNTGKTNQHVIDIDLQEQLLEVMLEHERIFLNREGDGKSTKGVWGVGKKPASCVNCGTNERPHYARGKCRSCYNRQYKKRKKNG